MENENNQILSGSTSPSDLRSIISDDGITDDSETVISSHVPESVFSAASFAPPAPPVNSPMTQSLAGDVATMDLATANLKLGQVPGGATPPGSESDSTEGKAHLRGRVRSDVPLLKQLFKVPPKTAAKKKFKVTKRGAVTTPRASNPNDTSPPNEHVHEHDTWHSVAIEDVAMGLKRLGMAARDAHKIDDSKTVEEYYSEDLATLIKNSDVKFDQKYLQ